MRDAWMMSVVILLLAGCCPCRHAQNPSTKGGGEMLYGKATYYADSLQGNKTASGEKYDKKKLTAAHKTLPFGTKVKVTNLDNGKSVVVTINDRGPFGKKERIIDLSRAAAEKIGMIQAGVVDVSVQILE